MSEFSCKVRNLRTDALSGFRKEKEALAAGGRYLHPDADGWLDANGYAGLCIVCENCGSIVEEATGEGELYCPDCGESTFRVFQTFRLVTIKDGFVARWHVSGLMVAIDVPASAIAGMIGIHYTTDVSDPTLASPVYTQPIPYRKEYAPIRAAVYYSDARSQIIEWDYDRAEKNRNQIRKQTAESNRAKPTKTRVKRPKSTPKPKAPEASPGENKDEGKGCGCLLALVMGIVGVVLISNNWRIIGWILTIFAVLSIIGMFQDEEK